MSPVASPRPAAGAASSGHAGVRSGFVRTRRQRRLRAGVAAGLFALVALDIAFRAGAFVQLEATLVVVYAIAALGQDLLMGRDGQISLGAAAFMAIGAFVTAGLDPASWAPFPVPLVLSALAGGVVGLGVGFIGLRFRGLYLALATLALQFIVAFAGQRYQGVNSGGMVVGIPHIGSLSLGSGRGLFLMLVVVLVLVILALSGIYGRAPGRAWAAIRQGEEAAAVAGVDVTKWKLLAFVSSSALTALGGSLYAYVIGTVSYVPFSLDLLISILTIVFVGGLGSISGALVGSVFVVMLPHWLNSLAAQVSSTSGFGSWLSSNAAELSIAVYGLALMVVLLFERGGLVGIVNRVLDAGRRRVAARHAVATQSGSEGA